MLESQMKSFYQLFLDMEDLVQVNIKCEPLDHENEFQNPWDVANFDDFLHYNCPECEFKAKRKKLLYIHAVKTHVKAQQHFKNKATVLDEKIKTKTLEIKTENVSNYCEQSMVEDEPMELCPTPQEINQPRIWDPQRFSDPLRFSEVSQDFGSLVHQENSQPISCCQNGYDFPSLRAVHCFQEHGFGQNTWTRGSHKCPVCNEVFPVSATKESIEDHFLLDHAFEPLMVKGTMLLCALCQNQVHDGKFHKMGHCANSATALPNIPVDMTLGEYKCDICDTIIQEDYSKFRKHRRACEITKKKTCPDCGYYNYILNKVKRHIYTVHGKTTEGMVICELCSKVCYSYPEYQNHQDWNHLGKKRPRYPRTCDKCGKVYRNISSLKTHLKQHHMPLELRRCDFCAKELINRAELFKHYENDHPNVENPVKVDNDYVWQCRICNQVLGSEEALFTHYKLSHKLKVFSKDHKLYLKQNDQPIAIEDVDFSRGAH